MAIEEDIKNESAKMQRVFISTPKQEGLSEAGWLLTNPILTRYIRFIKNESFLFIFLKGSWLNMNLFHYEDPALFIQDVINQQSAPRGTISKMAAAAGCQVSYFSQFLRGKVALSPDHAAGLSEYLAHSSLEAEFFLSLVLRSRASSLRLKENLSRKMEQLRLMHSSISGRIQSQSSPLRVSELYYSSWLYAAVHVAVSIEEYQNVPALAARFQITAQTALQTLLELETMGLVRKDEGNWVLTVNQVHLPPTSVMTFMNHLVWRQRALLNIEHARKEDIHFSSVCAISREHAKELNLAILDFISKARAQMLASPSEEVFCLNIDCFKV